MGRGEEELQTIVSEKWSHCVILTLIHILFFSMFLCCFSTWHISLYLSIKIIKFERSKTLTNHVDLLFFFRVGDYSPRFDAGGLEPTLLDEMNIILQAHVLLALTCDLAYALALERFF